MAIEGALVGHSGDVLALDQLVRPPANTKSKWRSGIVLCDRRSVVHVRLANGHACCGGCEQAQAYSKRLGRRRSKHSDLLGQMKPKPQEPVWMDHASRPYCTL